MHNCHVYDAAVEPDVFIVVNFVNFVVFEAKTFYR